VVFSAALTWCWVGDVYDRGPVLRLFLFVDLRSDDVLDVFSAFLHGVTPSYGVEFCFFSPPEVCTPVFNLSKEDQSAPWVTLPVGSGAGFFAFLFCCFLFRLALFRSQRVIISSFLPCSRKIRLMAWLPALRSVFCPFLGGTTVKAHLVELQSVIGLRRSGSAGFTTVFVS